MAHLPFCTDVVDPLAACVLRLFGRGVRVRLIKIETRVTSTTNV
jgi:hypothetical protein